jgi:CRP-like cAMP-binding protein
MRPTPADLRQIALFASLSSEDLARISTWLELRTAGPGTVLVGEGASGYSFFVLRSGSAIVHREGEELTTLTAGDFFGELAILGNGRRTASVTATTPVTLYVMFGTEFRRLEDELPAAAEQIRAAMAERVGRTGA